MIYNQKDNYFSENASKSDIEASFMVVQKNNKLRSLTKSKKTLLNSSNGKVMNMPIDETLCIDWYLIETITWPDGYVSVEETYLYTTCPPSGGGGGGGGEEEPEPIVEFGQSDDTPIGATMEESSSEIKIVNVSWYCYKVNGTDLKFKSYEKIKIGPPLIGTQWLIANISHTSMSPEGTIEGQNISSILNWAEGETTMNSAWAKMKLNFKDKRTYHWKGILRTRYSPDINAARSWGVYELLGH